jgi:hypothetical protein
MMRSSEDVSYRHRAVANVVPRWLAAGTGN